MASYRWDLCRILKVFVHASSLQLCSLSVHSGHLSRQLKFKCKEFKVSFKFLLTKVEKMRKKRHWKVKFYKVLRTVTGCMKTLKMPRSSWKCACLLECPLIVCGCFVLRF